MTKRDNDIRDKIIKGLELSYRKLVQSKKERNLDFIISDNAKGIRLHAKDC